MTSQKFGQSERGQELFGTMCHKEGDPLGFLGQCLKEAPPPPPPSPLMVCLVLARAAGQPRGLDPVERGVWSWVGGRGHVGSRRGPRLW